jgi:hypothetical protein
MQVLPMKRFRRRSGIAYLEALLVLSILVLVLQMSPVMLPFLDVRNWSSWGWFAFFAMACIGLCLLEYGAEPLSDFRIYVSRLTRDESTSKAEAHAMQEKLQAKKRRMEEREQLKRMKEAQRRRIY